MFRHTPLEQAYPVSASMRLVAWGFSHQNVPLSVRERVAFRESDLSTALPSLRQQLGVAEALILSTCNRTELYSLVAEGSEEAPLRWLSQYKNLPMEQLIHYAQRREEADVIRQLLRVTSGLDSMVLGEAQILGQTKMAYKAAREHGALGSTLERLMQHALSIAKRVRTETHLGDHSVSVAHIAVVFAKQHLLDLRCSTALLIGAGETISQVADLLSERGVPRLIIANRTHGSASLISDKHCGTAVNLDDMPNYLHKADIVFSATSSSDHILRKNQLEEALEARGRKPIFLVDLAVPRDIDPDARSLRDVYLYDLDDLQKVQEKNQLLREFAAKEAEAIVSAGTNQFARLRDSIQGGNPTVGIRRRGQQLRDEVLEKARQMLLRGGQPDLVLHYLANALTNKFLHKPSVCVREAAIEGDAELINAARRLLGE